MQKVAFVKVVLFFWHLFYVFFYFFGTYFMLFIIFLALMMHQIKRLTFALVEPILNCRTLTLFDLKEKTL